MTLKEEIEKTLKSNREKLTDNSRKTYTSLLVNLWKKLKGDDKDENLSFFTEEKKKIIEYINGLEKLQSQKTLLSALYILTHEEEYRTLMLAKCKLVNDQYKEQKMSADRKEHYISFDQIKEKYLSLKNGLKKNPDAEHIVDFLIVAFMSGVLIPPRRNEWCDVKIRHYDKDKENFLDKNTVTFHTYKTESKYGVQVVKVPRELHAILKKWIGMNETDYLLYNANTKKKLSSSDLTKRIHRIFQDSKIGCDMFRSIYLSHIYKDVPKLTELQSIADSMGHNITTAMTSYVKKG
jgi:integrase